MRLSSLKLFSVLVLFVVFLGCTTTEPPNLTELQKVRNQWHVVEKNGEPWPSYWLVNKEFPDLKQEMFIAGPIANDKPWIDDIIEVDEVKEIYLITYYAGQPGTSELVNTYYALIYNAMKKTILGHYPYSYKSSRANYSPEWIFEDNRIVITGEDLEPVEINFDD